jgi:Domain of unknown function (DUF4112)
MNEIQQLKNLQRIRKIANLLDTAIGIPGTKFRIGLDPILGLIPGGGDLIAALISAYMIYLATRFRLEKEEIGKMVGNVAIETIFGSIPLIGDIFDAYYKANIRNLKILENHLQKSNTKTEESKLESQIVLTK